MKKKLIIPILFASITSTPLLTLVACGEKQKFTLIFETDDPTVSLSGTTTISVEAGTLFSKVKTPEATKTVSGEKWEFAYWYIKQESNDDPQPIPEGYKVTGNVTICPFFSQEPLVTDITITGDAVINLGTGEHKYTAEVKGKFVPDRTVAWDGEQTSDCTYTYDDNSITITPQTKTGKIKLFAYSNEDPTKYKEFDITVAPIIPVVTDVNVVGPDQIKQASGGHDYYATVSGQGDYNKYVRWEFDDGGTGSTFTPYWLFDNSGYVIPGETKGTATLTAISLADDEIKYEKSIEIVDRDPVILSVNIDGPTDIQVRDEEYIYTATVEGEGPFEQSVEWSVTDPDSCVTWEATGFNTLSIHTTTKGGSFKIKAISKQDRTKSKTITVTIAEPEPEVKSVWINGNCNMAKNSTNTLKAVVEGIGQFSEEVSWEIVDDPDNTGATIDEAGLITSTDKLGEIKVKATSKQTESMSCTVSVAILNEQTTDPTKFEYFYNIEKHEATIEKYIGDETDVVTPKYIIYDKQEFVITKLNSNSFRNNQIINSVIVNNGIDTVRTEAFASCPNLTSVTLPGTVKLISTRALYNCPLLDNVTINMDMFDFFFINKIESWHQDSKFTKIHFLNGECGPDDTSTPAQYLKVKYDSAKSTCTVQLSDSNNINKFKIPDVIVKDGKEYRVVAVRGDAYDSHRNITHVILGKYINNLWSNCLKDAGNLKELDVSGVEKFSETCLANSGIEHINLSDKAKTIEWSVFESCKSLQTVHLGNNVQSIGGRTFYGCYSLNSINIPYSVKSIYSICFQNTSGLSTIDVTNWGNNVPSTGSGKWETDSFKDGGASQGVIIIADGANKDSWKNVFNKIGRNIDGTNWQIKFQSEYLKK